MDYEEFVDTVKQYAGLGVEEAERAVRATLETLAERLSKGERRDILQQLPAQMKPWMYTEKNPEPFDVDEFLRRVAEREQVDVEVAERHAREVFWALGQAVDPEEIADMAADLPEDFDPLIAEAQRRNVRIMPAEEFLTRVANRAGLDVAGARQAVRAVLETLAERIADGQVRDLIRELPIPLHEPLKQGMAKGPPRAVRMSLDDFVRRVAEREGVRPLEAREHAQAVFTTLREAITEKEFLDVMVELPPEYRTLLVDS